MDSLIFFLGLGLCAELKSFSQYLLPPVGPILWAANQQTRTRKAGELGEHKGYDVEKALVQHSHFSGEMRRSPHWQNNNCNVLMSMRSPSRTLVDITSSPVMCICLMQILCNSCFVFGLGTCLHLAVNLVAIARTLTAF